MNKVPIVSFAHRAVSYFCLEKILLHGLPELPEMNMLKPHLSSFFLLDLMR